MIRASLLIGCLMLSPALATEPGEARYLGPAEANLGRLRELEPDGSNLFASPRTAYVIVTRRSAETTAKVIYAGGSRTLKFSSTKAQFRILVQRGRDFKIEAVNSTRICFQKSYTLHESGVWEVPLPC